jgi:hypothetical protein
VTERTRQGGCGCGATRYSVSGDPIFTNNCHCTQCQHQTGSTSVVNAFYEADRITLDSGALTEHTLTAGSGGPHIVCRCSECGVALWSFYPRLGRLGAGVRVGTLDDATDIRPDAAIFMNEKMSWVTPPQGIPAFETTYDFRQVIPPERVARMQALLDRRQRADQ